MPQVLDPFRFLLIALAGWISHRQYQIVGAGNIFLFSDLGKCMKSHIRTKQLESNLTARVSAAEAERVKACAVAENLSVSQWVRRTLLDTIDCPPVGASYAWRVPRFAQCYGRPPRDLIDGTKPSTERV